MEISEGEVDDTRPVVAGHRVAGVYARRVEKGEAVLRGQAKVRTRISFLQARGELEGIRCRVVDVEVASDQIWEVQGLEGNLWGDGSWGVEANTCIDVCWHQAGQGRAEAPARGVDIQRHEVFGAIRKNK